MAPPIGGSRMSLANGLESLRKHPVGRFATALAGYLGAPRDLAHFTQFLSLASGRIGLPVNLEIRTDEAGCELIVADRILTLSPNRFAYVDTPGQLRRLEQAGFAGLDVIVVRHRRGELFSDAASSTCRIVGNKAALPSTWRVAPAEGSLPNSPFTLRIITSQLDRKGAGAGLAMAIPTGRAEVLGLGMLLDRLPRRPRYPYRFVYKLPDSLAGDHAVVFERLLHVVAALRIARLDGQATTEAIMPIDYSAVRGLLMALPLVPVEVKVSAAALKTAEAIFDRVKEDQHHVALPDRSADGHKWFTRGHAVRYTPICYSAAKEHLDQLENEGILEADPPKKLRVHGRTIHFKFQPGMVPPFRWRNPFQVLPLLDHDAGEFAHDLRTDSAIATE
ncbi:MAG: hypothetical protein K2Y37_08415 [Pirellulales bacterium]|nr:hypothetical protein [Pirellulales bacterium]